MKKILYLLLLPLFLVACEGEKISVGNSNVVHYLNFYGDTKSVIMNKNRNYYVSKNNYDNYDELYWIVQSNKDYPYLRIGMYDYFVMLKFKGNVCNFVGLMNVDTMDDYRAYDLITKRYGNPSLEDELGFYWLLRDGSFISIILSDHLYIMRLDDPTRSCMNEREQAVRKAMRCYELR